jgi:hypothetical protein
MFLMQFKTLLMMLPKQSIKSPEVMMLLNKPLLSFNPLVSLLTPVLLEMV